MEEEWDNESLQDVLKSSNKKMMALLREQVYYFMEQAKLNKKLYIAFMNEIFNEIEKRLEKKEEK